KAYPHLEAVPAAVDLAIVATPAPTVAGILAQCEAAGVKGAIILSAGFQECCPDGAALQRQLRKQLRPGGLRVLGPNSMGVVCSRTGFNATFAPAMVRPGNVGFISQCGSLLAALTGGGAEAAVACSTFFSVGGLLDVGWTDCLEYLGADAQTESIGI